MKAMTEATTSAQNNLTCVDATNMPQVIAQSESTSMSPGQSLTNGGSNASTSVQIDNSAMSVTDGSSCNGSGILVFQQKSTNSISNAASTNVPVLVGIIYIIYIYIHTRVYNFYYILYTHAWVIVFKHIYVFSFRTASTAASRDTKLCYGDR